jgi:lysophospholipase L1-like esterase
MIRTRAFFPASVRALCLLCVILVAEFAMLEAAMRTNAGSEAAPAFQSLFMRDPRVGYRLRPGASARYTTVEFSAGIRINAQGVRDDADIGPKAPDERRIVVLGDSLTLSVQVELAETFCKGLEARLNAADSRHHWRVINAGVQGYGPVDEWLLYKNVADAFEPDLVLVASFVGNAVAANDKEQWIDHLPGDTSTATGVASNNLRRIVRASMVLQVARLRVDQLLARFRGPTTERPLSTYLSDPPPEVQHGLDVTRRAVGLIVAKAAERGARTGIVLVPARFQSDDADYERLRAVVRAVGGTLVRNAGSQRFAQALAPLGVPMLDLQPVLAAQPDRVGLFFQQNVHLTPRGHQVVADALFRFLESSGLMAAAAR